MTSAEAIESASPTFGQRVRRARLERGLSQQEFADLVGVSAETIGRWERGDRGARPAFLRALAHATEKPITHYIDGLDV